MGFDCGFDIFPPLKPTEANRDKYERFTKVLLEHYGSAYGDGELAIFEQDRVACIVSKPHGCYIEFQVGERPMLPYAPDMCHYFLRFSSKVSGGLTARAEPYIREVACIARQMFGERVKTWHELVDDGGKKTYAYYSWKEINASRKRMLCLLDGIKEVSDAEMQLVNDIHELEDEEGLRQLRETETYTI